MDEMLWKQLTYAGEGATLIDVDVSAVITEGVLQKMPILQLLNIRRATGQPHRYKRRDAFPMAMPQGSGATATSSSSNYTNTDVPLKIIRSWGGVESFVEELSDYDTLAEEVFGSTMASMYELVGTVFWGDALANTYQFDGFDAGLPGAVAGDPRTDINRIDGDHDTLTKQMMDSLVDVCMQGGSETNQRALFMSNQMQSQLGRCEAGILTGGGLTYLPTLEGGWPGVNIGWIPRTYRGIPIFPCDFCRPQAAAAAVTLLEVYGAGAADADTYYYRVAPVTRFGEQGASAEVAITIQAGSSVVITVTMFNHPNSQYTYGDALYWKIYRGTVSGVLHLVKTVNAITYNASGTPIAADLTLTDDFVNTVRAGCTGTAVAGTEDHPLLWDANAPDEVVFLVDRDPTDGVEIPASRNKTAEGLLDDRDLISFKRLGDTRDRLDFMVRTFTALAIKQGRVHGVLRRVQAV